MGYGTTAEVPSCVPWGGRLQADMSSGDFTVGLLHARLQASTWDWHSAGSDGVRGGALLFCRELGMEA